MNGDDNLTGYKRPYSPLFELQKAINGFFNNGKKKEIYLPEDIAPGKDVCDVEDNGNDGTIKNLIRSLREKHDCLDDGPGTGPEDEKKYPIPESPFLDKGTSLKEVEKYWVTPPFAFISILYDNDLQEYQYYVCEPELSRFERELLERMYEDLRDVLIRSNIDAPAANRKSVLHSRFRSLLSIYGIDLPDDTRNKVMYYLERNFIGYGNIDPLLRDGNIEDISCNGLNIPFYLYHKKYQNIKTNIIILKEEELNSLVIRLVQKGGKHISVANPIANATLPDGSRIEATLGREVTTRGSSFTIRKFRADPFTPVDLIQNNTMSPEMIAFFWMAIENNKNILFSGGTASGKTSSLNAVSLFIPQSSKVITIEDTRELTLYHNNWIASLTRDSPSSGPTGEIDMYELLRAGLRQRPEYIIVGEVRGKEALTLFQAMNTGHTTYSTMHAGSIQAIVNRLLNEPINIPNMMLQSLNIVSIQELVYIDGKRTRRTKSVVEIAGVDIKTNNLRINELYRWNSVQDTFEKLAESVVMSDIMARYGWDRARIKKELGDRIKVLEYLEKEGIRDYRSVSIVTHIYSVMPDKVMELIERGKLRNILGAGE